MEKGWRAHLKGVPHGQAEHNTNELIFFPLSEAAPAGIAWLFELGQSSQ